MLVPTQAFLPILTIHYFWISTPTAYLPYLNHINPQLKKVQIRFMLQIKFVLHALL